MPRRAPRDFGAGLVDELIDGAVNNGFGRPVNVQVDGGHYLKQAYADGVKTAFEKFAVSSQAMQELAGLGLISVAPAYELLGSKGEDSPTTKKVLAGSDLAGLGLLAQPYVKKLLASAT